MGLLTEQRKDRLATALIRSGGVIVILVVVAIVLNIGFEALPLFQPARAGRLEQLADGVDALAVGSDPRREVVWALVRDGSIVFFGDDPRPPLELATGPLVAADHEIHGLVSILGEDGRLSVGRLRFRDVWTAGERTTQVSWRDASAQLDLGAAEWVGVTANRDDDGDLVAAAWTAGGSLALARFSAEREAWEVLPTVPTGPVSSVAIAEGLESLAVVERTGVMRIFQLPEVRELEVSGAPERVAEAKFLVGGGTLVAGGVDGTITALLAVSRVEVVNGGATPLVVDDRTIAAGERLVVIDDGVASRFATRPEVELRSAPPSWREVRGLPNLGLKPLGIAPASRRRDFLVGGEDGTVALYHSTSGRRLLGERWTDASPTALAIAPKGDGAIVLAGGRLVRRSIDNPHPEVSLRTLFLPVWYEGYAKPQWVWQTTGGSDAFEPKMSLWPLVFGTLKATLYAMLFSVPIALMAAVYVSQLAPSWLQSLVKPTLELMAAVPSVVVGFLAALWLAPRLESVLLAVLVGGAVLPLAVLLALGLWRMVPARLRRRAPQWFDLVVLLAASGVLLGAVAVLAGPVEGWLFGGDLQRWLFTELGVRYDQRNSIVVGLALGFAVIPVIFTIAEDACSAVPRSLVNASRALGATRWQTATRMVAPAASPGLFAAVMLGFGRAVGETMIVLMAAGNTPLLDLSPFNGMRTMSAAIAVEIAEAPVHSTLFRVLFLTGTLLFLFTLVLTTAADLVGSYLRRRYARF